MSRVITDLPDEFDPVELIKDKVLTCPICGKKVDYSWYYPNHEKRDANGIRHQIRTYLNKYRWDQWYGLKCAKCGCQWDTGWIPADHEMFEVVVDGDKNIISDSVNKMLTDMGLHLRLGTLSDEDLQELQDRFGEEVRFVVEDMISGKDNRWG